MFKFPWLEFRFKSFLELHVHFKDFMCIRMRKLHAECQIPADAHDWCQIVFSFNVPIFIPKYWTTKQLSQFFGWSVRTLALYNIEEKVKIITGFTILIRQHYALIDNLMRGELKRSLYRTLAPLSPAQGYPRRCEGAEVHKLFTVCTKQVRFPNTEHAASGI